MANLVLELGLALSLVALAGLLAARSRFSAVPFFILAGLAVGPHTPLGFVESAPVINFLGRLGLLVLLFYLGLEFSVGRLLRAGRSILLGGVIYMAINLPLGLLLPWLLGWPLREILVAAGITTISSTAIAARLVVELKRTANPETEMILGLMLFQDAFVVVYLAVISGLVLTGNASPGQVAKATLGALAFMAGFLFLGRRLKPLLDRWLDIPSDELLLLVIFAALTLVAGLAESLHLAEAVGALLVGLVLGETEHFQRIQHLVVPFRDFFSALFFFSFGLGIDPLTLKGAVWPALAAVALTLVGNFTSGLLAGRTAGLSPRASTNVGLTITARGEFSIILANLARAGGLLPVLQSFAALYVVILAVLGPLLTKESRWIYARLRPVFRWPALPPRKQKIS
jgi:CPA2 family monovalent cation:H+ antiporter-2